MQICRAGWLIKTIEYINMLGMRRVGKSVLMIAHSGGTVTLSGMMPGPWVVPDLQAATSCTSIKNANPLDRDTYATPQPAEGTCCKEKTATAAAVHCVLPLLMSH
jgi:hypothetical protein